MNAEQILQERLERLETGERLEHIVADLPGEESALLFLAAQILTIPKPERNPAIVKAQQQKVIRAAQQTRSGSVRTAWNPLSLKWLVPVGLALVMFVAVAGVWVGMTLGANQTNPPPDSLASSSNDVTPAGGLQPVLGGTPVFEQFPTPNTAANPQTASLVSGRGLVQVQDKNGAWSTVQTAELKAGQTFRTWRLSSAQLVFFDGSMVALGPNTQLTLETLNAPKEGPRQIGLFQAYGETNHRVVPSPEDSSYVVRTPNARGEATGTIFQVSVIKDKNTSFAVSEGEVAVTGQEATVSVVSGEVTYVRKGATPLEPVFWLNLQGEVSRMGDSWVIGGTEFQTHEGTVVVGFPQIRDIVLMRGRLMPDGAYMADRIELYSPATINRFRIFGVVEEMGVSLWTISGQEIHVNENTQIEHASEIGSPVLVRGVVQEGGALLGTQIQLVGASSDFEFTGLVEQIEGEDWTISGVTVTANEETEITGDPEVGNLVQVKGQVLPDGTWLAHEIETVTQTNHFEFTGTVEAMAPWVVDGISFEVNDQTQISPNLEIGDQARVEGIILQNGTWLANEIQLFEEETELLVFVGIVADLNPWVVNGISLNVTEETVIVGEITVAALVRVYVRILEDGSWQVIRIELIDSGPAMGCIEFSDRVVALDDEEIVLQNGLTISRRVAEISGELAEGVEVRVQVCFGPEGAIIFASMMVIDEEIEPTPTPEPTSGDKVTLCHVPPGNSNNAKTIMVDASAVDAHLSHGDYLGACQNEAENGNKDNKDNKDDKGNGNNK